MKVLHIASFNGNVGDIVNHQGFYRILESTVKEEISYTQIEMREYYKKWGIRKFDNDFVELANSHDLVIIGGGAFFRLDMADSSSGTTVDISREVLEKISTPILFNCLGCIAVKATNEDILRRFKEFLKGVTADHKCLVTVRNDGSYERISTLYDGQFDNSVIKIPDGGFNYLPGDEKLINVVDGCVNVAINLAIDQADERFNTQLGMISYDEYVKAFADYCDKLLSERDDIRIIFVAHIFSDLRVISDVMSHMNDIYLRTRVSCAPLVNGKSIDGGYIFDLYNKCDVVIGTRYHANVVPIGMGVANIGLITYESVYLMLKDVGLENRCVWSNRKGFEKELYRMTLDVLDNLEKVKKENVIVSNRMKELTANYSNTLFDWMKREGIV